jgi:SpoIIAA-like
MSSCDRHYRNYAVRAAARTRSKEIEMLEALKNLPPGLSGLKAVGRVTKEDYEGVFVPLLDDARRDGRHLRFLYELGPELEGFTAGAAWEDAKVGLRALSLFEGCAIVSDADWISRMTRFFGFLMPCPVRVFRTADRDEAVRWLQGVPEGAGASHHVLSDLGVIVVEVTGALRAHDFDSLALTADAWIEAHGHLQGVVIRVRAFPGWENLGSLLRHLRFVRDHHRKVRHIALVSDVTLFGLAPRLAEHFVEAEVKTFGYEELDSAIAWAGTREKDRPAPHERSAGRET